MTRSKSTLLGPYKLPYRQCVRWKAAVIAMFLALAKFIKDTARLFDDGVCTLVCV